MIKKLPKFENFTKMDLTAAGLRAAIRKIIFRIKVALNSRRLKSNKTTSMVICALYRIYRITEYVMRHLVMPPFNPFQCRQAFDIHNQ